VGRLSTLDDEIVHWLLVADADAISVADVEGRDPPADDAVNALVEAGAHAAAYVTYVPGASEHVITYAVIRDPRDSDIRSSRIVRSGGSVSLGDWENVV
jgi:hypothetical protein